MAIDPYIGLVDREDGPASVDEVFEDITETRAGELDEALQVNELWQAYGNAPQLLATFWPHMRAVYREGDLSHELISKVSLVTASVLDCEKCRYFHTTLLAERGVDPEEIERLREREVERSVFSERDHAVLRFAESLAADYHGTDRSDVDALREVGLTDGEIVEVVDAVAIHVHTAVFQSGLGLLADQQGVAAGPLDDAGP